MPKQSFAENVMRWEQLSAGLTAKTDELPFLAEESATLAAALTDIKALNAEQEALKAQLQAVTQRLEAKVTALTEQESRLRASLKGKYGAKNEALETFGIKPPKAPARKKAIG